MEALVTLANGDMRKSLNILQVWNMLRWENRTEITPPSSLPFQSCSMAYDEVTEDNVYTCVGHPLRRDVEHIVKWMLNEHFTTAYNSILFSALSLWSWVFQSCARDSNAATMQWSMVRWMYSSIWRLETQNFLPLPFSTMEIFQLSLFAAIVCAICDSSLKSLYHIHNLGTGVFWGLGHRHWIFPWAAVLLS